MADFEKVFEDLDVKTEDLTGALNVATGATAEDNEAINNLLAEM